MDSVTQRLLSILGFPDGIESLPSMRQLKTQYRRTSLKRHPDKPGGTKGHFQELLDAFEKVGNLILNMDQSNLADDEETKARKEFKEFNFTKKNTFSFTIYVQTYRFSSWESVLTEKNGEPVDRTEEGGHNNGKQWTCRGFQVDGEPKSTMFITLWNKPNSDKSTMLIQAESNRHFLIFPFLEDVIPQIYKEVVENYNKSVAGGEVRKSTRKSTAISKMPKLKTIPVSNFKYVCKSCEFQASNVTQLNAHMKTFHGKPKATPKALSIFPVVEPMPIPYYSPFQTKSFEIIQENHILNKSIESDFQWFDSQVKKTNAEGGLKDGTFDQTNRVMSDSAKKKDDLYVSSPSVPSILEAASKSCNEE